VDTWSKVDVACVKSLRLCLQGVYPQMVMLRVCSLKHCPLSQERSEAHFAVGYNRMFGPILTDFPVSHSSDPHLLYVKCVFRAATATKCHVRPGSVLQQSAGAVDARATRRRGLSQSDASRLKSIFIA
jgi:hypothetical protein